MERKAIFVPTEVHKNLKVLSAEEGLTMNMLVEKLINFYKANQGVTTRSY